MDCSRINYSKHFKSHSHTFIRTLPEDSSDKQSGSVFPYDTSSGEVWIEPPAFRLADDRLYLLSRSRDAPCSCLSPPNKVWQRMSDNTASFFCFSLIIALPTSCST